MNLVNQEHDFIYVCRVVGSMAVVILHVVGVLAVVSIPMFSADWWVLRIVSNLFIWANPLFIMMSGALLLTQDKKMSLRQWYKRRWVRVGVPTLFWLAFYAILFHFNRGDTLDLSTIWEKITHGPVGHLHFLIEILELYTIAPLFQILFRKLTHQEFGYLTLFFLFLTLILPTPTLTIQYFVPYIGFFLLGAYLLKARYQFGVKKLSSLFFLLVFLLTSWEILAIKTGFSTQLFSILTNKIGLPAILLTSLIFLIFQQKRTIEWIFSHFSKKEIKDFSDASFGIYLVHPAVLLLLTYLIQASMIVIKIHWQASLGLISITYLSCYVIVKGVRRSELLKGLV